MYISFLTESYEEADNHLKDHYHSSDLEVSAVLGEASATAAEKSNKRPRKPKEVFDPSTTPIQKHHKRKAADNCVEGNHSDEELVVATPNIPDGLLRGSLNHTSLAGPVTSNDTIPSSSTAGVHSICKCCI